MVWRNRERLEGTGRGGEDYGEVGKDSKRWVEIGSGEERQEVEGRDREG